MGYEPSDIEILQMEDKEHLNFHASRRMLSLPCRGFIYICLDYLGKLVCSRGKSPTSRWYLLWSFFYLSWAIFSLNSCQLCGREQLCRQNRKMPKQTKDKKPIIRWQMRHCGMRQHSRKGQQSVFCWRAFLLYVDNNRIHK